VSWLDDIFGTAKSAASTVVASIADIPQAWSDKVAELKARAAEFMNLFNDLEQRQAQAPCIALAIHSATKYRRLNA